MSTMQFRPAKRSEAKPLIGLYAESGAGKTLSALLLARGFVGPTGKIGMIETESGRGESYGDKAEYPEVGGYDVLPLRESFSPRVYGEALEAAERAKLDALIIDSASHEWEGIGGVLEMAAKNQEAGKKGPLVWQQPKIDHQRYFMLRFMQSPIPLIILNMRAKYPMEEKAKTGGGKDWVRSETLEPKQSEDILFEMFLHGWISRDSHAFNITKCTNVGLRQVFEQGKPISLETGRKLAAWSRGEGISGGQAQGFTLKTSKQTGTFATAAEWQDQALKIIDKLTAADHVKAFTDLNQPFIDKVRSADPVAAGTVLDALESQRKKVEAKPAE